MDNNQNKKTIAGAARKKKKKAVVRAVQVLESEEGRVRNMVKKALRDNKPERNRLPSSVTRLLASIALPKDYLVPRLGGSMGSDPTALANPWSKFAVSFPQSVVAELNTTTFQAFVFRDPLRAYIGAYQCPNGATYGANFLWNFAAGFQVFPRYAAPGGASWTHGDLVYGSTLYPGHVGQTDQHRGFLFSTGQSLSVSVSDGGCPPGAVVTVVTKRLSAGVWVPIIEFTILSGMGVVTSVQPILQTGYYAITVSCASPTPFVGTDSPAQWTLTTLPATPIWQQLALPNYSDNYKFIDAIRITGVSLMYTNTSAPINRQGQVVGLQCPKGSSWFQFTDFDTVASDKKSEARDIVNGNFGFLKPTSLADFNMNVPEFPSDTSAPLTQDAFDDNVFLIYPTTDYLCTIAQVLLPVGQSGYITLGYSTEYTTLNQWIQVQTGNLGEPEIASALELLSKMPQWHENDLHWDDVWSWIKDTASSIWNGVKEVAPLALGVASLL